MYLSVSTGRALRHNLELCLSSSSSWVDITSVVAILDNLNIAGIPWTCDIVSAAVSHAYGTGKTFEIRLMLDILNLLTVIFLMKIIKHQIYKISSGGVDLPCPSVQAAGGERYQDQDDIL